MPTRHSPRRYTLAAAVLLGGTLLAGCQPGTYGFPTGSTSGHVTSTPSTVEATTAAADDPSPATSDPSAPPTPTDPAEATTGAAPTGEPTTTSITTTPLPTTSSAQAPAPQGGFPNASNTGVPAGTTLGTYDGPCTVTVADTVIDSKTVNCELDIKAANVTIKNSKINGMVDLDTDVAGSSAWSYTLQDSEVDGGTVQLPAVSYGNMTVIRSNIHGGETAVQCGEHAVFCTVRDSWLHGQNIPQGANWHLGGFLSNGGMNVLIQHNTVVCDARPTGSDGGCTGDINLFGDFAAVSHVTVDSNYMGASTGLAYCTFGGDVSNKTYPHADHVVYRNNVFQRGGNQKCGDYGPVSNFNVNGPGNQWTDNTWEDGTAVAPAM